MLLLILWAIISYNGFIKAKLAVDNSYSQINIQCKKRFDLVPNLVETVKGYANYEKTALEDVIKARSGYLSAGTNTAQALQADGALNGALSKLFALSESYPELKANAGFRDLQKSLENIEQKIVYARQFHNDSVLKLNNKVEMFPSRLIADLFKFRQEPFFEAAEAERENIKVSF